MASPRAPSAAARRLGLHRSHWIDPRRPVVCCVLVIAALHSSLALVDGEGYREGLGQLQRERGTLPARVLTARQQQQQQQQGGGSVTQLYLLPDNPYGAKCLDGSPPGYYHRLGYAAGSVAWHIHLPGGGWCTSVAGCVHRAQTDHGSTRSRPRFIARGNDRDEGSASPARGINSPDPSVNPVFHNWHLVRPIYCDGGGFAGRAGWRAAPGGGSAGNGTAGVYLDGWKIIHAVLNDLKQKRGMARAASILLTGSSAGGQAVITLCDRVALIFPGATVKCILDAGFFVDAEDRWHGSTMGSMVHSMVALHAMRLNLHCTQAYPPADQWRCFFAHRSLRFVSAPLLVVNSLFDYRALTIGNQLRPTATQGTDCLRSLLKQSGGDIKTMLWSKEWRLWGAVGKVGAGGEMAGGGRNACQPAERRAVLNAAWRLLRGTDAARRKKGTQISNFVTVAVAHCSLTSPKWTAVTVNGTNLRDAVTRWWFTKARKVTPATVGGNASYSHVGTAGKKGSSKSGGGSRAATQRYSPKMTLQRTGSRRRERPKQAADMHVRDDLTQRSRQKSNTTALAVPRTPSSTRTGRATGTHSPESGSGGNDSLGDSLTDWFNS
ncbi:hypothetical protein CLOM_g23464 [Closterium sp. NIES-68]|nr:hypothetical protein CLOM_g23464 [Closterium sp. NIES-68]GJP80649.1 hypothetical protein CLOP_g10850 [Closterium sp. NIES-67]